MGRFLRLARQQLVVHCNLPLEWNVTMEKDTVVQSWLGGSSVKDLVSKGYKVIDSNYNYWVSAPFFSPPINTTN